MRSLEELRNELDRIDPQIIQLYEERMSVCEEVGEIKIEEGRKVFDREPGATEVSAGDKGG